MHFLFSVEATHLRDNRWAVRPAGACGTMGWTPYHWDVVYVSAPNTSAAIQKAAREVIRQQTARDWR